MAEIPSRRGLISSVSPGKEVVVDMVVGQNAIEQLVAVRVGSLVFKRIESNQNNYRMNCGLFGAGNTPESTTRSDSCPCVLVRSDDVLLLVWRPSSASSLVIFVSSLRRSTVEQRRTKIEQPLLSLMMIRPTNTVWMRLRTPALFGAGLYLGLMLFGRESKQGSEYFEGLRGMFEGENIGGGKS